MDNLLNVIICCNCGLKQVCYAQATEELQMLFYECYHGLLSLPISKYVLYCISSREKRVRMNVMRQEIFEILVWCTSVDKTCCNELVVE